MAKESFRHELRSYLAAGYAALYVLSPEEERAEGEILAVAKTLQRGVWIWELGEGWLVKAEKSRLIEARDPTAAIKAAMEAPDGTVLILRDYHHFIKVPENQRKIKSALSKFSNQRKTFIFLSPVQMIPPELEKLITPVEMTLPSRDELGLVLDDIAEGIKEEIPTAVRSDLLDAAAGLTINEAADAFARARVIAPRFDQQAVSVVQNQKAAIVKKSGLLEVWDRVESPENLGGMQVLKEYFMESRIAFTPEAQEAGVDKLNGVLLLGPAGVGKSLSAKIAASIFQWPLFRLDMGRIFGSLVGMSEERARYACTLMEAVAPCVVWLSF